jgi:hypothetical protein
MKMRTDKRELDKLYKRRDRYEIPDWQRDEVWDTPRKQLLIDTILRGWKIPKFYFVKNVGKGETTYDVVDGQQRLSAIFEFLAGELELSEETEKRVGGKTYSELTSDASDAVDDFEIDFDEIEDATDEEIMDFFQRLQGGMQLNSSEKLNSIQSKLRSFCKKIASSAFFKNKVAFNNKRYSHFDVAAKVAAIEVEGLGSGLRYEDVKVVFESQANFSDKSAVAKRILYTIEYLNKSTPLNSKVFKNRSITQSFITLVCAFSEKGILDGKEAKFYEFAQRFVSELATEVEMGQSATDADYLLFQKSVNANVKTGSVIRHQVLLRKLFQHMPELLDESGLLASDAAGFAAEISSAAGRIQNLIKQINEVHSSHKGSDLFKPTNKTMESMVNLPKVPKSYSDFKTFIEDMYFLLWEGPGGKIEVKPKSFSEINILRTEMEHDVDHGGAGKFAKKKANHAEVFEKYSGLKTPSLSPPERFPLVKLGIMKEVESDLIVILAEVSM